MDAPPVDVERLVTVRQAARLFGIGRHLLFQAAERGELDVFDPGGWARVKVSDVQKWLERTKRVPRGAA
jgi:excisionase family DNA binding protein